MNVLLVALVLLAASHHYAVAAEYDDNGWLEYNRLPVDDETLQEYKQRFQTLCVPKSVDSAILSSAQTEWFRGLEGLLGVAPDAVQSSFSDACRRKGDHGLILEIAKGNYYQGYRMRTTTTCDGDDCAIKTIIRATSDKGLLTGVFGLLRRMQTNPKNLTINVDDEPRTDLRIWNLWDNLDGTIERGHAGDSIFNWNELPDKIEDRYNDYARLLASVGTNGISLSNVHHACDYQNEGLLNSTMLPKLTMVAELFGNWGIDFYPSPCFNSPKIVGGLDTADPMDERVSSWWSEIVSTISHRIPTFKGFVVQASHYGRSQSVCANMFAKALEDMNGTVIWRVMDNDSGVTDPALQSYQKFFPLEGEFYSNVVLQLKSGPMDHYVREPVSPLFGGLQKTRVMLELDVTQHHFGQGKALVALAPQWEYYLSEYPLSNQDNRTRLRDVISAGVSGVSNIGNAPTWAASVMSMPNAYAWGRMAWDPYLSAEKVLDEWIMLNFGWDDRVRIALLEMLLYSYEAYENYTSPMGLGSVMDEDGVTPNPDYVNDHQPHPFANETGIGYDRTVATGSGFIGQYDESVVYMFENIETCPEQVLLFMHHVDWKHPLASHGNMQLIQYLYSSHGRGVRSVDDFMRSWAHLGPHIEDEEVYNQVADMLTAQVKDATDYCVTMVDFFQRKSGIAPQKPPKELCDATTELKEEEIVIKREKREAAGIGGGLGVVLIIAGMIFTAYQVQEYPDGVYASICRVAVVVAGYILKVLLLPCRTICLKHSYRRQGHMPIGQIDYQESYNGQTGHYS